MKKKTYNNKNYLSPLHQKPRKKKAFGQHFLRKQSVVDHMIAKVAITPTTSVMEIGCGDGFLTKAILAQTSCKQLWCFEIDHEWAQYVRTHVHDNRLTIHEKNILELDWNSLAEHKPWVLLANIPYNITFPILFLLKSHRHLFSEGVLMIQEEVAQKMVAKNGRSSSAISMLFQHYFDLTLMEKIEPGAFVPPPKIFSRLLYFKPRSDVPSIVDEENFWNFVRASFKSPRRTLKNNLASTHFEYSALGEALLQKRAQELSFNDFLNMWEKIPKKVTPL